MSISVLSITAQAPAVNASAAPLSGELPLTSNSLPINFAALLGGQLAQLPESGVIALQGDQGANSADKKGFNLASYFPSQWPGIRTGHATTQTDQELIPEMPLAAQASPADSLATLIDRKSSDASAEKGRVKALEHANQNAHYLRGQASELNADSPLLATTQANPQSAEGVLALIAPQPKEEQANSGEVSEDIPATIDPVLIAQTLPPYQNIPLENRPTIDVDRNKQPSLSSLRDALPAEEPLLPPQSNLDSKSPGANNLSASLAQSIVTPMANADTANLAAPSASSGNSAPPAFASLMVNHTQNASQAPVATSTPTIATTLQDSRWPQEFSDRIVWIAKNDQQLAQINITPAQLGPVQITINLNGDQASINFASPHAEVRKAIEDAMPNLRDMLASSGINLGQSNVGSQLQQQQHELPGQFANGTRVAGENAILPADSRSGSISSSLPIQRGRGLVDLFA